MFSFSASFFLLLTISICLTIHQVRGLGVCDCANSLCLSIRHHPNLIEARVISVLDQGWAWRYGIQVILNIKGHLPTTISILADKSLPCLPILQRTRIYLLFLEIDLKGQIWLSGCFNSFWSALTPTTVQTLYQCTQPCGFVCEIFCEYGNVLDSKGCPTCACNPCPPGVPQVQCFVEPCALQATQCPNAAYCVDDYCGGCKAHYYDQSGTQICLS